MRKVMDLAAQVGAPVIGLNDGGGARIQEGVVSLGGYGDIFFRNVQCSGVIPQISVIIGPCAGGAVYSPAMTDFIFMVKETSHMFITGPDVVKTVTGEEVELEELGGAMSHASKSGVAHFVAEDEESCLEDVRYLLGFLPSNNLEEPPRVEPGDDPERAAPSSTRSSPTTREALRHARRDLAESSTTATSSRSTRTSPRTSSAASPASTATRSASSATSPPVLAGVLDIESSEKAARFVRTCDAFNIPLVTFVDVPGFLPGIDQEYGGIIRHGAKLLYAYCEATVPKLTGHHPQGLRRRLRRDELQAHARRPHLRLADRRDRGDGPAGRGQHHLPQGDRARRRRPTSGAELIDEYKEHFANPYVGGRARLHRRRDRARARRGRS